MPLRRQALSFQLTSSEHNLPVWTNSQCVEDAPHHLKLPDTDEQCSNAAEY